MNRIVFPLKPDMRGAEVDGLQGALQLFLDRGVLSAGNEPAREELITALKPEHAHRTYGKATRKLVGTFQEEQGLHASGTVDQPTANAMNRLLAQLGELTGVPEFVVRGTVRFADGQAASKVRVAAYDRDLRSEQLLGEQDTDDAGVYEIEYLRRQFINLEKGGPDLVVRAMAADGSVLVASAILFNAPPVAQVDLTIPPEAQQPSLFARLSETLQPLLGTVQVEELEENDKVQDVSFLAGETGFSRRDVARYILARRLDQRPLPAEFWFVLLGGGIYDFVAGSTLAEQLQAVLDALPNLDERYVRRALALGFAARDIDDSFIQDTETWVAAFLSLIADRVSGAGAEGGFVSAALQDAGIQDPRKRQAFARLFNEVKAFTPEFGKALETEGSFSKEEIADLSASFQLADLTRGDFSVVGAIKEAFRVRQPDQVRVLARMSEDDWVSFVQQGTQSGNVKIPFQVTDVSDQAQLPQSQIYGKMLARSFREAFPTTAFSGGLQRAIGSGAVRGIEQGEAMARFLEANPAFEFLNTPIDGYFSGAAAADLLKPELKAVQRVFKLAPSFEASDALLADGLHSAQKVYRIGETEFVRRYANRPGFTEETARLAWNRAADTHAAALTVVADLKARVGLPAALQMDTSPLSQLPNWNNLFSAGDLCECEPCRSVLSPAAYFADLLMFLKDRSAKNPAQSVKDVLFRRRPDLGYLELNCENALTPFPYIDTVCEVLEDVVAAGANDLDLTGFTAMPSDPVAAKAAVASAFAAASISLGDGFTLSQVDSADPNRWVAHGDEATCLLKKKAPAPDFFAEILRNTKRSAEELRAYPQYVNPKAYLTLRQQKYPMALPFDLFAEEVRAAFKKTSLQRWDLVQTLRGLAAPNDATDGEIAAEYFGISADALAPMDEKRLILVADPTVAGQQAVWGETGANWLSLAGNVKNFLKKTGLSYQQLLELLDLKFINPTGDIVIVHLDPSCDTGKQVIQVLDEVKLDRIHRFLRLWTKLDGWQMWELDLVLRSQAIGTGTLDEPFLINLFYLSRVLKRLGSRATVERVAALFQDLNTSTRFTKLHEKRADPLYQTLFLNRRLVDPIDPAFQLDPATQQLPPGALMADHHPVLLAALGVRETDLLILKGLTKASDGTPYLTDDLTLGNLSFLWRHAWLSKLLKFKADQWRILLKLFQQDIPLFASPRQAWEFLDNLDRLVSLGFTPDQLDWILAANRSAKAAVKESDASRFLLGLRKELQGIQKENDPAQFPFLSPVPPTDADSLTALLTSLLQKLGRNEVDTAFFLDTLRDQVAQEKGVPGLPPGFDFPAAIRNSIAIRYNATKGTLRFTGVMTPAEQTTLLTDPSLAAVTGLAIYQQAIAGFFNRPRLALKFFQPLFTAPLAALPPAVDFTTLADPALALKISYDPEQLQLVFSGIMTDDEKSALDALSNDPAYRNAVNSLATQPALVAPPDPRIWLLDADLKLPLADHLPENLATAAKRALGYLSRTFSEGAVVQTSAAALGLSEALTRVLFQYALLPDTLLTHFTTTFAATTGVVDYATLKGTFDAWYWAIRVASVLKKWNVSVTDLRAIEDLTTPAQLLDLLTLPLDDAGAIASLPRFIRAGRLLRLRDSLPETSLTLFDVLEKLNSGGYAMPADFAADVTLVNDAWSAADVAELVTSLDLAFPADYLLTESWERLRHAFYFLDSLNASAATVKSLAAAAMGPDQAKAVQDLLRSKFGVDSWLDISAEVQDALRERKRNALAAYLLSQPQPADAPSGKWENTNDLYAYYLLDIDMTSCMLTSRLVQGSGSIQLFVQRCFMGLEPAVEVRGDGPDGDSAWHWWDWMRKYRLWEANREVFLWPENWIEPELKKDRSSFFKGLEADLMKSDVTEDAVESAFSNYLEKLDSVAQLEIAGFYQEDRGDQAVVHVFGRTKGAEPHVYYYRTFDYRFWSPWEKVDLDIQGDYLVPAVINQRLFLFWPVFSEAADEPNNNTVRVPKSPGASEETFTPDKTWKKLQLKLAVSEYREGKWTPRKISKDFAESSLYQVQIVRNHYIFFPIDRSGSDGRFGVHFSGFSEGSDGSFDAFMSGSFEITGCKGVPELTNLPGHFTPVLRPEVASAGIYTQFMTWAELVLRGDLPEDDFTLQSLIGTKSDHLLATPVLMQTPWLFKMTPPWHLSYLDKMWLDIPMSLIYGATGQREYTPAGTWLPFFYNDKNRTFFVLPTLGKPGRGIPTAPNGPSTLLYYPDIKKSFVQWEKQYQGLVQTWVDNYDLSALTPAQRQQIEQIISQNFPEEPVPPYTDPQLKALMVRFLMRFMRFFLGQQALHLFMFRQFHFKNFYHPSVCDFAKLVYNPLQGIPALMCRETQLQDSGFKFAQWYQPTLWVVEQGTEAYYPVEDVDFTPDGAYSPYNWELFFHAPLLIGNSLSRNQRFEEARNWYHFIFNPIGVESTIAGGSVMSKYWITKPFYETTDPQYLQQRIDNLLRMLAGDTSVPGFSPQAKKELEDQVIDWRNNPFEPHRIAAYRTVAYQKTVVMKYLDNLINWGDFLFRQDSMESVNEATQLYVLAAEILGPRPLDVPPQALPPLETFNELESRFDVFSNALVEVENLVPVMPGGGQGGNQPPLPTLYFCIPPNDKLLSYWDTVADRLFKIRHCMNIEGVVRQLPLFEPPIDPGALVKAVAGGVDIGSVIADLNAPLPLYRFSFLLQKANELVNEVKALGASLLAALEKQDAEALSLLRQGQESAVQQATLALREIQVTEAQENVETLNRSKLVTTERRDYYRDIQKISPQEQLQLDKLGSSQTYQEAAQFTKLGAAILSVIPAIDLGASGFGGSPVAKFKIGGLELGQAADLAAEVLSVLSTMAANESAMAAVKAAWDRRFDDWKLQERLADKELNQMDSQIAAANDRVSQAQQERDNQALQIQNSKDNEAFLRSKFTNEELYQWQVGQISSTYFQSYKLAYDLAKRAERCYRFELGIPDASFVSFGYWDSLKKGLLGADKLQYDLRRLESSYLELNRREFEITKHVSLLLLDPLALVQLRETGRCFVSLPEEIFDLDYPGHYFRRIKSVSITLPCVVGPYTAISCTLRLLKNGIRINTENGDNGYRRNTDDQGLPAGDARFVENNIPVKAIAASSAENDSGVFELNFRDDRYLPFEGGGVISQWSLELFNDQPANNPDPANPDFGKPLRQFDYGTISDAIIHVKYTAREDAGSFKDGAVSHLRDYLSLADSANSLRLFSLRQEFPTQWSRFLKPNNPADGNVFQLEMSPDFFRLLDKDKTLRVNKIWLLARCTDAGNYDVILDPPLPPPPPAGADKMTLAVLAPYGGLHAAVKDATSLGIEVVPGDPPVVWQLKMTRPGGGNLQQDPATKEMEVQDLYLVVGYQWA